MGEIFNSLWNKVTGNFDFKVDYDTQQDEEIAKKHGFDINNKEMQNHLFNEYNRIRDYVGS